MKSKSLNAKEKAKVKNASQPIPTSPPNILFSLTRLTHCRKPKLLGKRLRAIFFATATTILLGASQLYQANADDFDYQNQPDSGTYENIINFDGGDTLTIDGYSYTFGSETSPFKIFDTTGNEVSRDSIKHVNITVSDSASTSFGANGTGNANGVSESWTVVDGGSFIVDAYLVIGGIAESGNGGDGNFTVNGGTVTGSFELVLCNA